MNLLSDNPIQSPEEDQLGHKGYAELLAESIIDSTGHPLCIGIFGAWGVGKTSIMKMIQHHLKIKDVKTVWFNPWKYNDAESVWNALIQTILSEIAEDQQSEAGVKAKKILTEACWSSIKLGAKFLTSDLISSANVDKIREIFANQNQLFYQHKNHFEASFQEAIELYVGKNINAKLVIFIDDLDRCLPKNAITILDSLKLFVGDAPCVFVIAMDPEIIELGIKSIYNDKILFSGRDYLDKIIQVPFSIPPISANYLQKAISNSGLGTDLFKNNENRCTDSDIWWILENGLDRNLRKYKRFLNSFSFVRRALREMTQEDGLIKTHDPIDLGLSLRESDLYLAKLLIIQMVFYFFYDILLKNPVVWFKWDDNVPGISVMDSNDTLEMTDIPTEIATPNLVSFMKRTNSKEVGRLLEWPPNLTIHNLPLLLQAMNLVNTESSGLYSKPRAMDAPESGETPRHDGRLRNGIYA